MQDEAAKRGWQLVYTDAAGSAAKQVADVRSMIAQKVDVISLAPREDKPLILAVMEAKKAGIPLLLIDRNVDASLAKGGEDYVAPSVAHWLKPCCLALSSPSSISRMVWAGFRFLPIGRRWCAGFSFSSWWCCKPNWRSA